MKAWLNTHLFVIQTKIVISCIVTMLTNVFCHSRIYVHVPQLHRKIGKP